MIGASLPLTLPVGFETHDGLPLRGKVTLPAGAGPWPVVVFIGGSGVWDSDYASLGVDGVLRPLFPLAALADRLAEAGLAVVRYQKRGVTDPGGRPTPAWRTATVTNLLADARTVLGAVKVDTRFGAIAVVAHSEGTMVATGAAAPDPAVRALVLQGMGYRNAFDIVRAHRPDVSLEALEKRLAAAAPDDLVLGFPAQWWKEHQVQTSMAEAWRTLTTPVLIQHGENDAMVTPDDEAVPFAAQLAAQGHPDFQLARYPGLDHFFKDPAGAFQLDAVVADLAAWLHPRLA